jgi:3-hydroxybutyryl-CoA dehydrogenase
MSNSIRRVGVIGAGLMGHSLAVVHAIGGLDVKLQDIDAGALARAPGLMDAVFATLIETGTITAPAASAARNRITIEPSLGETVRDADLVVKAVVEKPDVKRAVFAEIARHAPAHTIVASNTSHLDIFPLVPDAIATRTVIAHWYTPPYIVDLVDLVGGEHSDPQAIETLRALYRGMGKQPIVLRRFIAGYVANRIQAAISQEVFRLLDEGYASAADIDAAVIHGLALRIPILGHLMKADFTGIEMVRNALANRSYEPPPPRLNSPSIDRLLEEGRKGVMSGAGFFDYGDKSPEELFRERDRQLLALKKLLAGFQPLGTPRAGE